MTLKLKQVLLELGGISGSGVQTKDGYGPFSGKPDPKKQKLRDLLTTEVPARTSPAHHQMTSLPARSTAAGQAVGPGGTAPSTGLQVTPGGAFLPPGTTPQDFDTPPEDLQTPTPQPQVPGRTGPGISRQRAGRQQFDPSRMLSPEELAQAKKQLGLESILPTLSDLNEAGKYSHNITHVLGVLRQAKREKWIDKILHAVPELQQLAMGRRPDDVEKAFELSFRELARLLPRD
jgi:hypothetical protein